MDTPAAWQLSWPAINRWQAAGIRISGWQGSLCRCRVMLQWMCNSCLQAETCAMLWGMHGPGGVVTRSAACCIMQPQQGACHRLRPVFMTKP